MAYKDPEVKKQKLREWREKNREKVIKRQREYREKRKEAINERARELYREKYRVNPEKILEKNKKWKKNNREAKKLSERKSYAKHRSSRLAYLNSWRDKTDPSRPLRRSLKSFKRGDIKIDEFLKQSRREIERLNGELRGLRGDRGVCGGSDQNGKSSGECG